MKSLTQHLNEARGVNLSNTAKFWRANYNNLIAGFKDAIENCSETWDEQCLQAVVDGMKNKHIGIVNAINTVEEYYEKLGINIADEYDMTPEVLFASFMLAASNDEDGKSISELVKALESDGIEAEEDF